MQATPLGAPLVKLKVYLSRANKRCMRIRVALIICLLTAMCGCATQETYLAQSVSRARSTCLPLPASQPRLESSPLNVALSGGGYRAMLFHVGALWRLHELGLLEEATQISSVSAGSLTAAVIALQWDRVRGEVAAPADSFDRNDSICYRQLVAEPLMKLADDTIDIEVVLGRFFVPGTNNGTLESFYIEKLFGRLSLSSIPDSPVFRFNATNLQTGAVFSFFKDEVSDASIGTVRGTGALRIATAVAASSAFPPFLSPVIISLGGKTWDDPLLSADTESAEPQGARVPKDKLPAFRENVILVDGAVADNLGLESIWRAKGRFLISDGGGATIADSNPSLNFLSQSARVMGLIYDQPSALRAKTFNDQRRGDTEPNQPQSDRDTVANASQHSRGSVAYWSIAQVPAPDDPDCPSLVDPEEVIRLSQISTRFQRLSDRDKKRLINWGYHSADYSLSFMAALHSEPYFHSFRLPFPEESIFVSGARSDNCRSAK